MIKMKHKIIIKWLFLLIWMIIIFLFSNQANSGEITHNVIQNIIPLPTNITNIINFIIRKMAHLTEYFILAILTINLLKEYTTKQNIIIIVSIIFCFTYATTDEFHQSFIANRTSSFKDVLIDTTGSLIAIIPYTIYHHKKSLSKTVSKH